MWCRLAPLPSNTTQIGMVCDQPTSATATPLTYTGDGLAYNGVQLVSPGPGQPLLLANTTATPVTGPTADNLTLTPAEPSGACCRLWSGHHSSSSSAMAALLHRAWPLLPGCEVPPVCASKAPVGLGGLMAAGLWSSTCIAWPSL
jgi:hypothetical protein